MAKFIDKYFGAPFKIVWDRTYHYFMSEDKKINDKENEHTNIETEERLYQQMGVIKRAFIFFDEPTHIIDGIYLGSAYNAAKKGNVTKYNYGLVINVTKELSQYCEDEDVEYHNFPLYDNNKDSIIKYLDESYYTIKNFKSDHSDKNVLVHCFMGASRSASVMIHYLMKEYNMTFDAAIAFVRGKRKTVNLTKKLAEDLKETE